MSYIFTSESVSEGHPDKLCDQISDAVLDLYLSKDPEARVACETLATSDVVILAGEVRSKVEVSHAQLRALVRDVVRDIGYEQRHFHWKNIRIEIFLHNQSPEIAMGVDESDNKPEGAGDQGIMFGYACRETPEYMPASIFYAHRILETLSLARRSGEIQGLGPDAKSQVSLVYGVDGKPVGVHSVVVSTQHDEALDQDAVSTLITPYVKSVFPASWAIPMDQFYVNPTGKFVIGGPDGDCGLTGRKIIVDSYGGAAPHGGGAFSGKDPTKVDRSAAYAARYLAKNVVAAGLAEKCTIQLCYAIGIAKPLAVYLNTHGTGKVDEAALVDTLQSLMDLTPKGIRTHLGLNKPIYRQTASYGHFGRTPTADGGFSWEKLDLAGRLKSAF